MAYRILLHELITGKPQDDELVFVFAVLADLLVEFLQPFELRCEAAFGGCVHDENDFVFEVGEGIGLAFFCIG